MIARVKGFFAKHGMTDVSVLKQGNWAAARDNLVIGSPGGGTDEGRWQMPMPHLIHAGIITNGRKVPTALLCQLDTQHNGIAVPVNRDDLVKICSARTYFNRPVRVLKPPYAGVFAMGDGKPGIKDYNAGPLYWTDSRGNVSYTQELTRANTSCAIGYWSTSMSASPR